MAGNYTTVVEHKKITIIPYLKIQVRGLGVLVLILSIHIPIFGLTLVLPNPLNIIFFGLTILSCLGSLILVEDSGRDKSDHIFPARKFYYAHIKRYQKINVDGQAYYLRGKRSFNGEQIERRKSRWLKITKRSSNKI